MQEELKENLEEDEEVDFDQKNPLIELLSDVEAVLQGLQNKEALLDSISKHFKKRQRAVFRSTCSMWFRKYEIEVESKKPLQRRLERTVSMNKILSRRLMETKKEARPIEDVAGLELDSPVSKNNLDDPAGYQLYFACEQGPDCSPESIEDWSVSSIGTTTCPLCSRHLDDVYEQLKEKDQQIKSLSKVLSSMNCGGQMLISQNNMCKEEMNKLARYKSELTVKSSMLERELTKLRAETTESKRHYNSVIEQYRRENDELKINLSAYEAKLESYAREAMRSSQGRTDIFNFSTKKDACVSCNIEDFLSDQPRRDSPLTSKLRAGHLNLHLNDNPLVHSIVTTRYESNSESSSKNLTHTNRNRFLTNTGDGFRSDGKLRADDSSQFEPPQTSLKVEDEHRLMASRDWPKADINELNSRHMRSTAAFRTDPRLTLDKQQTKGPENNRTKRSSKKKVNPQVKETKSYTCTLI